MSVQCALSFFVTQIRRHFSTPIVTLSALMLAIGCQTPTFDDELNLQAVSTSPGSLAGTFAQKMVQLAIADLPIYGETETGAEYYSLITRAYDDETQTYTSTRIMCSGRNYEAGGLLTALNDDAYQAVDLFSPLTVTIDHGLGTVVATDEVELWAIELDDAREDEMPEDAEEAATSPHAERIVDADSDSNPGMTMEASGLVEGQIYFIQRKFIDYNALVVDEGHILGTVNFAAKQVTIDATNDLLKSNLEREPHPNKLERWFEEIALPSDATCDDVLTAVDDESLSRLNPLK